MAVSTEPDFRALFEGVPGLYVVLDQEYRIVAVSQAYLDATRTKREELLGRELFDILPDNPDDPGVSAVVANVRASLDRVRLHRRRDAMAVQRYDIRRPADEDGEFEVRYWSTTNAPVVDSRGSLAYIIHRAEDVTEFVRLQELESEQEALTSELRERTAQMEAEIVKRSIELQETNRELRAASDAKNEFLSRMSHELRTPLTAIMGFSQLLGMSEVDPQRQRWVATILKASDHLVDLVTEVLDLSRIESGRLSISPEPVALKPLLDDALELMRPLAESYGVTIRPPAALAGSGYVFADAQRLKQVLINLISNAVKYNREHGEVRVDVAAPADERVRISVEDTGEGIDEVSLPKLFVPFERLNAAATGVEGTGLGLALSRNLVEAMGGSVGVTSTPGVGTRFWVDLNRGEPDAVEQAPLEGDPLLEVRTYSGERRLLYIEDTIANVRLLEEILRLRPSIRLLPAMQGSLGLDLAHEHKPHLILLDQHLPDLGGDEVLAQLRADEATRDIPVVILSADATGQTLDFLRALGAKDYLTKPIRIQRLLEVVDEYLG